MLVKMWMKEDAKYMQVQDVMLVHFDYICLAEIICSQTTFVVLFNNTCGMFLILT